MGNTNIPQAGAAHEKNGRETLSGNDQLTDEQKKQTQRRPDPAAEARLPTDHAGETVKRPLRTGNAGVDAE